MGERGSRCLGVDCVEVQYQIPLSLTGQSVRTTKKPQEWERVATA